MKQEQRYITSTGMRRDSVQRAVMHRLLFSLLIGLLITLLLTLLEVGVLWLLNPGSILGGGTNRFAALVSLPVHIPLLLLVPLVELLVFAVGTRISARPIELSLYLKEVHRAQADYHKLYTPLTALTNIRKARDMASPDAMGPTVYMQEEQVSILDLVQQQETHQLILGVPGAGKTMALRVYQYNASQKPLSLMLARGRIAVYVPMKNYSLFLKKHQQLSPGEEDGDQEEVQATILEYLYESDLPGIRRLRPYLQPLSDEGRLLLLCDGLNEVDSNYVSRVSEELVRLMRDTNNRLVMTCREVDYREQRDFIQLVDEGQAARAVIYPLQSEQVYEFVERYVTGQDRQWKHTAGQIMQVIDRSRLRYHCTNPMMLFTLMEIIDKIGVERGKQIDTRGRLLRESVKQLIEREQKQARWSRGAPEGREVVRFLSEVACAARWANDRNAIQLRISSSTIGSETDPLDRANFGELADELQYWLDEHPALGPFVTLEVASSEPYSDISQLLQFARSSSLIEISPGGVLSFRHELIAEYFVAEYFFAAGREKDTTGQPIREEMLEQVGRWSEPVAIWAGLLDNPLELAERFGELGLENPAYVLSALALGLICVGVLWTPPQAEIQRTTILPPSIEDALSIAVRNRAAREELARVFTRCAEEGGQEVYRSLLPLIMVEGVDELMTLLDQTIVPEVLFTQLQDTVDNIAYEAQVKRLTRVLGRFGGVVIDRAVQLSFPGAERSPRLRAAAINILGGTGDPRAVEPLIARLSDAEVVIVERATNALIRLGPGLALSRVLQELDHRTGGPFTSRVHRAALIILGRFLDEQDVRKQVSMIQYQHILEKIVPVLTSNYEAEPEVQRQAREILVRQGCNTTGAGARDNRWEKVIEALIQYLVSQNEVAARNVMIVLQEIGELATPRLLELLSNQSDVVRMRVVEIMVATHDMRALSPLLHRVGDPAPMVQQQVARALQVYAPESIPGLIDLVLNSQSDTVADRAAQILVNIGQRVVEPIISVLFHIVPGRTRLLIQVLQEIHDPRAVPALITLLQMPPTEPLLVIAIVRAISLYPEKRVVSPLLTVLEAANPLLYEEAVTALSQLGDVALDGLIAALDVQQETAITQRVRRAILGMSPFPGEELIEALGESSDARAKQIMSIFRLQGAEAAQVLVRHLLHPDEYVRRYIHQMLNEMPGAIVVPALLEVLNRQELRQVASTFLLKYPEAAISPLVDLLGEHERGAIAANILPRLGPIILRPLVSGLDDQRSMARENAQRIILTLVRQSQDVPGVLREVVQLFNPPPPPRAREVLIGVLTNELADISMSALLEGLEDAHLIDDVAEAFMRLSRRAGLQQTVLDVLITALYMDERRRGAEVALIKIGAPTVGRVGALIIEQDQSVARAAKQILREVGVPALPFIWNAHSDSSNPARREAALEIFHSMRTSVIKDELVTRLVSNKMDDIAMAVVLLLERIRDEAEQHYADRVMIPELIDYVQTHGAEETNLRIIALLLLLGEQAIVDHLIQALDDYPQRRQQLTNVFLLFGMKSRDLLLQVFNDPDTAATLRAELATVLGMNMAPEAVTEYARAISQYGLSSARTGILLPEQLAIALRALGGLLAGGQWNVRKLQELRDTSKENDPARELFSVLLGWRYEPVLAKLRDDLQVERDTHKKELLALTGRIVSDQKRIQDLEEELEQIREEHGSRGDELQQHKRDLTALRANLDQATNERNTLRTNLEQTSKEKSVLDARLQRTLQDYQALQKQYEQLTKQSSQTQTR